MGLTSVILVDATLAPLNAAVYRDSVERRREKATKKAETERETEIERERRQAEVQKGTIYTYMRAHKQRGGEGGGV